ncbi:hypothetical protein PRZ48_001037 [Zasmidium cellare]|uniref:RRM domain-containing protein n=1 Tax=Zasmidium cellare TaxID=395010 RepID=A0ABR0F0F8_ZASCE|nr:hypothetical protein PRZ48_001037 [Zasmidium cellare]
MALPQPLEPDDLREPVIASSNRAADVGPYMISLLAEDPKTWMNVMPWEFPQNAGREEEEQFLRTFFTDREIRKQGGAAPPGNGYRFLKQVWMSCALWNVNERIPRITDKWLWENQNLVNDPAMRSFFFNEDVQLSTFFTTQEVEEYGPKLLGWAVKGIQGYVRMNQNNQQETGADQGTAGGAAAPAAAAITISPPDAEQESTNKTGVPVGTTAPPPAEPESSKKPAEPFVKHHDSSDAFFAKKPRNRKKPGFTQVMAAGTAEVIAKLGGPPSEDKTAATSGEEKTAVSSSEEEATTAPLEEKTAAAPREEKTTTTAGDKTAASPSEDRITTTADDAKSTTTAGEEKATGPPLDVATTTTADASITPATASAAIPAAVPAATGYGQGSARNFSSGSHHLAEERPQSFRRGRGNQGPKRNSFNGSRLPPRPPPGYGDARNVSGPFSPYGGPPAHMSPMPPGSAPVTHRMPSGGAFPSPVGPMPTLPQGQQFYAPPPPGYQMNQPMQPQYDPSMHHMQPQQQMFMQGPPPAPGPYQQYGPTSGAYNMQPPPFADRSNVHPNTRHFSNEQTFFPVDESANYYSQRRDSTHSRNYRGRGGFGGSMRGRSNRGRGSFSNEGHFMPRNAPSETNLETFPQHERKFSIEREGNWRRQDWQGRGQADNNFAQLGKDHQSCAAGCTRFEISPTCTTATKLILFNVSPSLNMPEVVPFFSQFGRVQWVSKPYQALRAPSPEMAPRWYMWVTFEDVSGARNCLAAKGLQWPGGALLPEVAKEHWDPDSARPPPGYQRPSISYRAQPDMTIPAQEVQRAPPQQEIARTQATPTRRDSSGYNTPVATDSSATPTASRDNTPKNKKSQKHKNRNKKRVEQKEDTSSEKASEVEKAGEVEHVKDEAAQKKTKKSEAIPSPSVEDAEAKVPEEVKKPESNEPAGPEASSSTAEVKVTTEAGPEAGGDPDLTPTMPAAEPVISSEKKSASVEPAAESVVNPEEAPSSTKQDEDVNDESFHTATGTPEVEKDVALEAADVATPTISTPKEQENAQEEDAEASVSDVGSAHASHQPIVKSPTQSPSPGKDSKKAPIPKVPSQKNVTIAVPPVDTDKANKTFGKAQSESLQVPQQRSASGSSDNTTAAFVTAPSTPAVPEPAQVPRSKKAPKEKGPEQTESFSIFGKTTKRKASGKPKDKKPAGKRKGSSMPETVNETQATVRDNESSAVSVEEPKKSDVKQEDSPSEPVEPNQKQDIAETTDPVAPEDENSKPADVVVAETEGDYGWKPKLSAKAAGKQPVGPSEEAATSTSDAIVVEPEPNVPGEEMESESDEEQAKANVGLGISEGNTAKLTKGQRKYQKQKEKKRLQKLQKKAVVQVTEMSHPGIDNHTSKSTYEFKGRDLGPSQGAHGSMPSPANAAASQPLANANSSSSSAPNSQNVQATDDGLSPGKSLAQRFNGRQLQSSQEDPSNLSHRTRSKAGSDAAWKVLGNGDGKVSPDDDDDDDEVMVTYYIIAKDIDNESQAPDGNENLTAAEEPQEEVSPGVIDSRNKLQELQAQENAAKAKKAKQAAKEAMEVMAALDGTQTETQ